MNMKLRFTRGVAEDLDQIWNFIAADDPLAADSFIDELRETCKKIAFAPHMGRRRDDLREGLRTHPHGNYVIVYTVLREAVEIVRIIHGYRNLSSVL